MIRKSCRRAASSSSEPRPRQPPQQPPGGVASARSLQNGHHEEEHTADELKEFRETLAAFRLSSKERLELQDLVVEEVEAAAAHHANGSAAPAPEDDGDASAGGPTEFLELQGALQQGPDEKQGPKDEKFKGDGEIMGLVHEILLQKCEMCEMEEEQLKMIAEKHVQEIVARIVSQKTAELAEEKLALVRQVEELRAKHQRAMVEFLSDFTCKMSEKDRHVKSCELECERRIEEERQRSLGLRAELDRLGAQRAAMAERMDRLLVERAQLAGQLKRLRAECERLRLGRLAEEGDQAPMPAATAPAGSAAAAAWEASDLNFEAERLVEEVSRRLDELPALVQASLAPDKARVGGLLAELRAHSALTESAARGSRRTAAPASVHAERHECVVGDAEAEPAGAPPAAAQEGARAQRVFFVEPRARLEGFGPAEG